MKYNISFLEKLENLFKESGYKVRYEKGNFKSGYCILHDIKVVVINKFVSIETKINCFIEVINETPIKEETLSEGSKILFQQLKQTKIF